MGLKWVVLFALVSLAVALPRGGYSRESDEYHSGSDESYEFKYHIDHEDSDENSVEFGHEEEKSGDRVEGHFYVLLPDGRLQKVSYYVDGDSGFVASVEFEGSAEYESEEYSRERSREHSRERSREYRG